MDHGCLWPGDSPGPRPSPFDALASAKGLPEGPPAARRQSLPACGRGHMPQGPGHVHRALLAQLAWPRSGGEHEVKPLGTSNNRSGRLPKILGQGPSPRSWLWSWDLSPRGCPGLGIARFWAGLGYVVYTVGLSMTLDSQRDTNPLKTAPPPHLGSTTPLAEPLYDLEVPPGNKTIHMDDTKGGEFSFQGMFAPLSCGHTEDACPSL